MVDNTEIEEDDKVENFVHQGLGELQRDFN